MRQSEFATGGIVSQETLKRISIEEANKEGFYLTNEQIEQLNKIVNKIIKEQTMKKVFLGGGCANSKWRDKLIPLLKIDYFSPVVKNWTPEYMKEEIRQKETCDYYLYVITPSIQGVYSIAEVIDDSNKRPKKTIFCVLKKEIPNITQVENPMCFIGSNDPRIYIDIVEYPEGKISFTENEFKSLDAVGRLVERNGGKYFKSLDEVANYLNMTKEIN